MSASYRTVFASGEAPQADEAYRLAQRELWARVAAQHPHGSIARLEHSTATRTKTKTALNVDEWKTEALEVSTVIITLLATIQIQEEGTK